MTAHTPGPWRVGLSGSVVCDDESLGPHDAEALKFYGGRVVCETVTPANALLIASAPELLEACRDAVLTRNLVHKYDQLGQLDDDLRTDAAEPEQDDIYREILKIDDRLRAAIAKAVQL